MNVLDRQHVLDEGPMILNVSFSKTALGFEQLLGAHGLAALQAEANDFDVLLGGESAVIGGFHVLVGPLHVAHGVAQVVDNLPFLLFEERLFAGQVELCVVRSEERRVGKECRCGWTTKQSRSNLIKASGNTT